MSFVVTLILVSVSLCINSVYELFTVYYSQYYEE